MKRFATTLVWIGAICLIGVAIGYLFWPQFAQFEKLKKDDKRLRLRIEAEERKNVQLRKEEQSLRTDPEYVEKVAREKLGLIKPGEVIYKFDEDRK